MTKVSSGQKAVLASSAIEGFYHFNLHWLIPHSDPVGSHVQPGRQEGSVYREENVLIQNGDCLNGAAHAVTAAIMAQIQR